MRRVFTTGADLSGVTGAKNLRVTQVSLCSLDSAPSVWERDGEGPAASGEPRLCTRIRVSH